MAVPMTSPPMAKRSRHLTDASHQSKSTLPFLSAGEFAHTVVQKQYLHMIQQEQGVLMDEDPEPLQQMRVGARRLRTALQIFNAIVVLPKAAKADRLRSMAHQLGELRDLDVQLANLRTNYLEQLPATEQKLLQKSITSLEEKREQSLKQVKTILKQSKYRQLKTDYEAWLHYPQYTTLAHLPLSVILPELLSPLLSELLLHPAWLIPLPQLSEANLVTLHDLRKSCKRTRYQTEFFTDFYPPAFQDWVKELKALQEDLGLVQDLAVLRQLLGAQWSVPTDLPTLHATIEADRDRALASWETIRSQYLAPEFRSSLHQLILELLGREL
jgi:CHAD domain-containing protein